ncbi:unnamed protein product, partial [Chrysoparadoxa australica]
MFDHIGDLLQDGNVKVQVSALECLPSLFASLGSELEPVLNAFTPLLAQGLAATNKQLVALTHQAIKSLAARVD